MLEFEVVIRYDLIPVTNCIHLLIEPSDLGNYVLFSRRRMSPDCFQNQAACVSHSGSCEAHVMLKWRNICGTNLPISIMEMFLPMQVRAPCPN